MFLFEAADGGCQRPRPIARNHATAVRAAYAIARWTALMVVPACRTVCRMLMPSAIHAEYSLPFIPCAHSHSDSRAALPATTKAAASGNAIPSKSSPQWSLCCRQCRVIWKPPETFRLVATTGSGHHRNKQESYRRDAVALGRCVWGHSAQSNDAKVAQAHQCTSWTTPVSSRSHPKSPPCAAASSV